MGVVGAMATTAAVVGTANAVSHRQQQKYAGQAAQQQAMAQSDANAQQMADMQQQMADMQAAGAQAAPRVAPAAAPPRVTTPWPSPAARHAPLAGHPDRRGVLGRQGEAPA
ncbi:MAG: SHOCT domain-containing protein [Chloroflexota bacterium]